MDTLLQNLMLFSGTNATNGALFIRCCFVLFCVCVCVSRLWLYCCCFHCKGTCLIFCCLFVSLFLSFFGAAGYYAHAISINQLTGLAYTGYFYESQFTTLPNVAVGATATGATAIVGTADSHNDFVVEYATKTPLLQPASAQQQQQQQHRDGRTLQATDVVPPTCAVSSCGPGVPCSDGGTDCYEFMRQIMCCAVSPYS